MNTYTYLKLEDAQNERVRLEELNRAKEEVTKLGLTDYQLRLACV